MDAPLLDIANLRIAFPGAARSGAAGMVKAIRGIDLTLGRERLAIVGESGSGKSVTVRAILGLLPPSARVTADRMAFPGESLLGLPAAPLRSLRGRRIAMVVQDPRQGFTPVHTIGAQLAEMVMRHERTSRRAARDQAEAMLADRQVREPGRVLGQYPHQLSGGMAQRAMIAMMLAAKPDLGLLACRPQPGGFGHALPVLRRDPAWLL